MKIREMRVVPVALADPPLRSAFGLHAPYALRTIVQLVTDEGITGVGETYGGAIPARDLEAARERIAGQAAPEEHAVHEPQNVVRLRRPWYGPAFGATATVAAAAAIVLGIWAGSLQRSLDEARTSTARQDAVIAILANPESQRASLKGAQGALVVDPAGEAALAVSSLGPAPSGKTYQAWVMEDGDPKPAGIFAGGTENSVLRLTRRVPPGATVAVTLERDGGAQAPTSRPLLSASRA